MMPKSKKTYHHGDLRRALIDAGEAELSENGLAGFSLRRVAARVGVSHAAPAHHFGDVSGLIDALAERGFRRLLDSMIAHQEAAPDDPYEQLIASGLGYLHFARSHPALFRLIFSDPTGVAPSPEVMATAGAAFMHLAANVAAVHGVAPLAHDGARDEVMACWTRVHGIAELILSGMMDAPDKDNKAANDAMFRRIFEVRFRAS